MEQILLIIPHRGKEREIFTINSSAIQMKNTFIEELKKYERKSLDTWVTKNHVGATQGSANLRKMIHQVTRLKQRMSGYRPLLSDDIVVAFESLL